jgi:hypothetical protein
MALLLALLLLGTAADMPTVLQRVGGLAWVVASTCGAAIYGGSN